MQFNLLKLIVNKLLSFNVILFEYKLPTPLPHVSSYGLTPLKSGHIPVLINKYIESLDDKEKIAINIAKDHLKSSFNLEKSIGFIKFKNNYNLK